MSQSRSTRVTSPAVAAGTVAQSTTQLTLGLEAAAQQLQPLLDLRRFVAQPAGGACSDRRPGLLDLVPANVAGSNKPFRVRQILLKPTGRLGNHLGWQMVVVDADHAIPTNKPRTRQGVGRDRQEIARTGGFDVYVELLLQRTDRRFELDQRRGIVGVGGKVDVEC